MGGLQLAPTRPSDQPRMARHRFWLGANDSKRCNLLLQTVSLRTDHPIFPAQNFAGISEDGGLPAGYSSLAAVAVDGVKDAFDAAK